jgi:hypothetical protein
MNTKIRQGIYFLLLVALVVGSIWGVNRLEVRQLNATVPCTYREQAYKNLELASLSQELRGTGLVGSIHGAVAPLQQFVLSVREPENFFEHREFSLVAQDRGILTALTNTKRHDKVCIQGRFLENPSPQKHILVESVQVLESWSGLSGFPPYEREAEIPGELMNRTSFVGKVHAIGAEGQVLVVEYKDAVIPIFVESPHLTRNLYRGDIVQLWYRFQDWPSRPTHLRLNLDREQPLKILDAIANWHEQEKVLAGHLVKFPQSPQLNFDVYALEVENQGVKRYFTLVNFENTQQFQKIRDKLAQIWDANLATVHSGRNMLINQKVMLEVRGRANIVSSEQANPQILLERAEDIKQIEKYL